MEFCDLKRQYLAYQSEIDAAVRRVIESARFIGGPEVADLERELAGRIGVRHAVACANGTDALSIALRALGTKPGDEVIVPTFTFIATAECVSLLGAVPVFCDVREDDYLIDPSLIENKISSRTKGVIAVSLFGRCADLPGIREIARRRGLWVIEDAAQSFGASRNNEASGRSSDIATTSFFPSKPLGCYGDGGALFTDNDDHARLCRLLANHGQSRRYVHDLPGCNSRLDALQAAVLRVKLRHLDAEIEQRDAIAAAYTERLAGRLVVPRPAPGSRSTWAQYTVRSERRDAIRGHLSARNIPTMVHYPVPLHRQAAFAGVPSAALSFPAAENICSSVFSLPMHPFLTPPEIDEICGAILDALK